MTLSDIKYFNDPAISNSDLGVLKDSPWYFRLYKDKKTETITADHFELGTLIHLAILEPELFVVASIDKPGGMMGKFIDVYVECGMNEEAEKEAYKRSGFKYPIATVLKKLQDKDNKKYIDFIQKNHGKLLLTKAQKWTISNVEKGIQRNPTAFDMLFSNDEINCDVHNELELYGLLEGVKIKGKIDKLVIDNENKVIRLIDLKSTSSAPYFRVKKVQDTGEMTIDYQGTGFFNSFKGWSYYRQMAFYKTLVAENFKELFETYAFECYMVPVNTKMSYDCSIVQVSDEWLEYGRKEAEELIFRYKEHTKEGQWMYPILDSNKGLIKL